MRMRIIPNVLKSFPLCGYLGLVSLGLVACSGDSTGPTPVTPLFWALRLNQHAVTLALTPSFDTVQLRAAALTITDAPLSTSSKVIYTVNDSSLKVDSAGLVTAKYVTSQPALVTARLTVGNLTLQDQVFVKVTATPPVSPLATFSIQPQTGDSARVGVHLTGIPPSVTRKYLTVSATDLTGTPLTDPTTPATDTLLIHFTSSDPTVATIDSSTGQIFGLVPGHVTFYAETDLYGVTRRDSLPYVIDNPFYATVVVLARTPVASVTPVLYFQPSMVTVNVGAVVAWRNQNTDSIDVVFDDSIQELAACQFAPLFCGARPPTGAGNIALWAKDPTSSNNMDRLGLRARQFPATGAYRYHSARYPTATGVIYVTPDL